MTNMTTAQGRPESHEMLVAQCEIQAIEASHKPEVCQFRAKYLAGRLLTLSEIGAWIQERAQEEGASYFVTLELLPGGEISFTEQDWRSVLSKKINDTRLVETKRLTLSYPVPDSPHPATVFIRSDGVLGRLKKIAIALTKEYLWNEAEAVGFVLTGRPPVPSVGRVTFHYILPALTPARIVLDLAPQACVADVVKLFREARRQTPYGKFVRVRTPKAVTEKGRALAVHLASTPSLSWQERLEAWNRRYPHWAYKHRTTLRRDALSAYQRIMGFPWKRPEE
ncbi:MAG: hypothetical protein H5T84_09370 [Thermoleophilia bacterium]|nr:hypothetical protein [Thermoleophilia bacterium]